ncbi:MAG: hypothetical protein GC165_06075 [Armatimonadetes bacterium]|nr:hypothetical protein [Armatimonadota bacterium]
MVSFLASYASFITVRMPMYHINHQAVYGQDTPELNQAVLMAIDDIQASAPDGGGYFMKSGANPPASPIGIPLKLGDYRLISPPRSSSYCSGASYAAFIGALDTATVSCQSEISEDRLDALRMQDQNGHLREDMVKMWGCWNADGPGSYYALSLFSKMGTRVDPLDARPGDFCNLDWRSGYGHSVVFLGWDTTPDGEMAMRFWSSQKSTNGLGDRTARLSEIKCFVFSRLTNPEDVLTFDPSKKVGRMSVDYDSANAVAAQLKLSAGL